MKAHLLELETRWKLSENYQFYDGGDNLKIMLYILALTTTKAIAIYAWHPTLKMVLYWLLVSSVISLALCVCLAKRDKSVEDGCSV